jgi:biotin carboxyl carrier protein
MSLIKIESEISGKVFRIEKKVDEKVSKDESILILESMKMEIEVVAPQEALIKEILVTENEMVEEGQKLVILELKE